MVPHNCDFCGVWHSSASCFHPGRRLYAQAEAAEQAARAECDALRAALVEQQQENQELQKELQGLLGNTVSDGQSRPPSTPNDNPPNRWVCPFDEGLCAAAHYLATDDEAQALPIGQACTEDREP
jgi:hypothetical protein